MSEANSTKNKTEKKVRMVLLDEINKQPDKFQTRDSINWDIVAEYVELLSNPDFEMRPVIAFEDGEGLWLADGYHRWEAYKKAGRAEIPVEIREGTEDDAISYSLGSNDSHGLRRSRADKRKAVEVAFRKFNWSDNKVAIKCKVSNELVRKLRNSDTKGIGNSHLPKSASENSDERMYTDKHGKTTKMDVSNIGKGQKKIKKVADEEEFQKGKYFIDFAKQKREQESENIADNGKEGTCEELQEDFRDSTIDHLRERSMPDYLKFFKAAVAIEAEDIDNFKFLRRFLSGHYSKEVRKEFLEQLEVKPKKARVKGKAKKPVKRKAQG